MNLLLLTLLLIILKGVCCRGLAKEGVMQLQEIDMGLHTGNTWIGKYSKNYGKLGSERTRNIYENGDNNLDKSGNTIHKTEIYENSDQFIIEQEDKKPNLPLRFSSVVQEKVSMQKESESKLSMDGNNDFFLGGQLKDSDTFNNCW